MSPWPDMTVARKNDDICSTVMILSVDIIFVFIRNIEQPIDERSLARAY